MAEGKEETAIIHTYPLVKVLIEDHNKNERDKE